MVHLTTKRLIILIAVISLIIGIDKVYAQDDLMDLLDDEPKQEFIASTFKTTRVVNGHSIEQVATGELLFLISHRFGRLNSGSYELFGLDQSTIRMGFEFGLTDRINIGVGRSTYNKTMDGFVKYKIIRQQKGEKNIPFSVSWYSTMSVNGLRWQDTERENYFSSRISYVNQVLIARKFSSRLSLQITPAHIHQNLVSFKDDPNDMFATGIGGRFKLTNRVTVNGEYFIMMSDSSVPNNKNALSLGVDIETGGHVFQLIFTNAQPMYDFGFITQNTGEWGNGDIYFGFNISRMFTLKK